MPRAQKRKARPELRSIVEDERASGGVPRRRRPKNQISEGARPPPVELDDLRRGNTPALEMRSHAERRDEPLVSILERDDGRVVEVVVVIVREQHGVERREVL